MKVPDEEGQANHLGSESCAGVGNGVGEALTGGCAGRVLSPEIGQFWCRRAPNTRKATAGTPLRRGGPAPGGVEDPRHAQRHVARESGDPTSGPGRCWGPHGEPKGYDRDGRMWEVGQPHSIGEAPEQRCWCARTGGGGGEKGAGQGERGRANQGPDTAPGTPVTCAQPRTAGTFGCLRVRPEAGARCGNAARRDLCGGRRETGVPTATRTLMAGQHRPLSLALFCGIISTTHMWRQDDD